MAMSEQSEARRNRFNSLKGVTNIAGSCLSLLPLSGVLHLPFDVEAANLSSSRI
jgi:hypothetical protein